MQIRVLRVALSVLSVFAAFLTGAGLLMSAAVKNNRLADTLLSYYPRYSFAMDGFHTLQDFKYPVPAGDNKTDNVGILSIDDPAWSVLLDFVRAEIAIRKSERNEPTALPSDPASASTSSPPSGGSEATPAPAPQPALQQLPEINFNRIKTIVAARVDFITAGPKPLVPPYRLIVIWPLPNIPRRVYEFLSFEEFRLDLRRMTLEELEGWALWLSLVAFGCGLPIVVLRWVVGLAEKRQTTLQIHNVAAP